MGINLLLQGVLMGLVVAVPVGPLGLLSISRALSMGAWYGLFSGLGIATADAFVAGAAALGISLISDFLPTTSSLCALSAGYFSAIWV
jgi:threonine/homoserine/homoserine lactone efflux protein